MPGASADGRWCGSKHDSSLRAQWSQAQPGQAELQPTQRRVSETCLYPCQLCRRTQGGVRRGGGVVKAKCTMFDIGDNVEKLFWKSGKRKGKQRERRRKDRKWGKVGGMDKRREKHGELFFTKSLWLR